MRRMTLPCARLLITVVLCVDTVLCNMHMHGGVKMGVKSPCDNGVDNLEVDWNGNHIEYTCKNPKLKEDVQMFEKFCVKHMDKHICRDTDLCKKVGDPIHKCMTEKIHYKDKPPLGGFHRPIWPMYGEYKYVPPQRWIHNLEHGAAVFLYHPCAEKNQIKKLKRIARQCLWRHIITPYRHLSIRKPFAIVTWGCMLNMNYINEAKAKYWLKKHAINHELPEWQMTKNGQYNKMFLRNATLVTDQEDSTICPRLTRIDYEEFNDSEINYMKK